MPFSALGLNSNLTKAIREAGYTEPTPIQTKSIPVVLSGRDMIGIAQTGTGKTAAFVLPILQRLTEQTSTKKTPRVLIVAPTRELVAQIEENARKYGRHLRIRMATVFGGVGENPQIAALRAGTEMIIATPGRLIDLMQQGHADLRNIETVVLDEADRMLDMGFLPAMRQIMRALPKQRQTLLFSATFSPEIEQLSGDFLNNPHTVQIGRRANPAESVEQTIYEVPKSRKVSLLLHLLRDGAMDSVLVFSRTKHGADKIARKLEAAGVTVGTLHSNRSQNQRIAALKAFKSGTVRVLVATDIAARGIDVEGISHVINFDFPPQPEDYVHRIGRTGRAYAIGDAISFVSPDDQSALRSLERFINRGIPRKRAADFNYAETAEDIAKAEEFKDRPRGQFRGQRSSRPGSSPNQQRSSARPSAQRSPRGATPSHPRSSAGPQRHTTQPSAQPSSRSTASSQENRSPAGRRRNRW